MEDRFEFSPAPSAQEVPRRFSPSKRALIAALAAAVAIAGIATLALTLGSDSPSVATASAKKSELAVVESTTSTTAPAAAPVASTTTTRRISPTTTEVPKHPLVGTTFFWEDDRFVTDGRIVPRLRLSVPAAAHLAG